jgi:hypothetical protein
MKFDNAINLHRKSGVAKWRDLLFILRSTESQWKRHPPLCHPESEAEGSAVLQIPPGNVFQPHPQSSRTK